MSVKGFQIGNNVERYDYTALDNQPTIPSTAADVGAVVANQGTANAGKFLVVGSDGIVAPVEMQTWQGGSY